MKIIIVTQYFWPENFRINDLAVNLVQRGHEVTVFTGVPNYPEGRFYPNYGLFRNLRQDYNGVKVIRVPILSRGSGTGIRLALNYMSFALCASFFAPFLCKRKYDLIFVFEPSPITVGLPALVLKKIISSPIMFWVQDLWPESLSATGAVQSRTILNLVSRLVKLIYRRCDKILVTSRAYVSSIEKYGIESARILYFPQYVESIYQPLVLASDASERAIMPEGFRVVFAGNIGAAQDFGTILDAAGILKEYTDIQWIIIGDGRMRTWVVEQVQQRKLMKTVHLLGRYPVESMPRFFSLADVLMVTLKRAPIFSLTIPGKVQSYMACGKPIIAALDGEGARLIEESGSGIVCPTENPDFLAKAVLGMYRMPAVQREEMGKHARDYYTENFEQNMLLNRFEEWAQELCKNDNSKNV
jgi:colanic acid biosynthesis glycosyl transferase WcaI